MKNLAASTAIALAFAAPAFADAHMSSAFLGSVETQALRASDLMGARLYVSEVEVDTMAGQSADWNDVGEISDILVGNSGEIDAVLVDIGGFLGLGERTVAVNMDQLQFVSDGDAADEYFIVLQSDQAALEAAPEFDSEFEMGRTAGMMDTDLGNGTAAMPDTQGTGATTTDTMTAPAEVDAADTDVEPIAEGADTTAAATATPDATAPDATMPATDMMGRPAMEVEGYETVEMDALTTEDVTGARVYGINDEDIGEIGELVMSTDGMLQDAIIDVGGFLGLGEKPVSVSFDEIQVMRSADDVRVYIDMTEEELTALPAYEG